jgi:hypothetical protein
MSDRGGGGTLAREKPPVADRDNIRVWGGFTDYRRSGRQRRWSKALVRHGADPGLALAGVLEVAADDIRLRDRPE